MRVLWCDHCGSSCLQWPHHGAYFVSAATLLGRVCVALLTAMLAIFAEKKRKTEDDEEDNEEVHSHPFIKKKSYEMMIIGE